MHAAVRTLDGVVERIGQAVSWLALLLVLWVIGNVTLRYFFDIGWIWSQQFEWHLLSPISLLGLSYALRHDEHVRVDIFYERYRREVRLTVDLVAGMLAILVALAIIDLSVPYVLDSFQRNEGSYEPGGMPYRFLLKAFIPAGFLLLLLQGVAIVASRALELAGRRADGR